MSSGQVIDDAFAICGEYALIRYLSADLFAIVHRLPFFYPRKASCTMGLFSRASAELSSTFMVSPVRNT